MNLKRSHLTPFNKVARVVWGLVWVLFYRPTPALMHFWRRWLLRLFGAKVEAGAHPYPSVRIWAPWNLVMGKDSCLAPEVDCYNVAPVILGERSIVSQKSYLCTASHDYQQPDFPLIAGAIRVEAKAWVAADVFVAPGVTVGEGAVVGARSSVTRDVPPWTVVAGNPARIIKAREIEITPEPERKVMGS